MVAGRHEGTVDAPEDRLPLMLDLRQLAMDRLGRADDMTTIGVADGLMAQAHAEQGDLVPRRMDQIKADARLPGAAGAGGQDNGVWPPRHHRGDTDFIIAMHADLSAKGAQVMHQVPGEAVIVVDERNAGHAGSMRRHRAAVSFSDDGGRASRRRREDHAV